MFLFMLFLSSGLFLGWSLGANDASNVFGTAVGTRMVRFKTAALLCSVFVVLGACISGAGAAHTLGELGSVNAIAGSFMVAFSAGLTVFWMTKLALPVSTSQAIVGAIIGWNLFSGSLTDTRALTKIAGTWVLCPLLAAFFAIVFFKLLQLLLWIFKPHLFRLDAYTRAGLIIVGALGAYSLGANNIANVMGVFVSVSPFTAFEVAGIVRISGVHQLFFIGGISIAIGVYTYSSKVMSTVGKKLFKLTPQSALVVVLAESIVLLLFASQSLETWLISKGLPSIPLVPVSSSQAVIGAVIGIGIAKGGRNIQWRVLGHIAAGWVTTPVIAGTISFFCLFFLQNVFNQKVYRPVPYKVSDAVVHELGKQGITEEWSGNIRNVEYANAERFMSAIRRHTRLQREQVPTVIEYAKLDNIQIDTRSMEEDFNEGWFTIEQIQAVRHLHGIAFCHGWQLHNALMEATPEWDMLPPTRHNKQHNKELRDKLHYLCRKFRVSE